MMTLNEAITHCHKVANSKCNVCGVEHEQLVEWLRDYSKLKFAREYEIRKQSELANYRLCYVEEGVMYFTDHFETQWADDANDAPYEHNAGTPYEWDSDYDEAWNIEHGHGHIRYLAFIKDWETREPCDCHLNSPYSVEDINNGAIAWLYNSKAGGLMAGATMEEAIEWCKKAEIRCGELK